MPEQTEWGIELPSSPPPPPPPYELVSLLRPPATPANGEYREPMGEARQAGKAKHHEQRLANATYTATEVEALTRTATELGRRLGRKEAAEEIGSAIEAAEEGPATSHEPLYGYWHAAQIARAISDGKTPAEVDDAILTDWAARRAEVARRIAGGSSE